MGTVATTFHLTQTDQDQAWGSDVRQLAEASAAALSTTICSHPSAAGTTTITLDPYTGHAAQSDNTINWGWAFNQAGADGLESGTHFNAASPSLTGLRRIPPGVWTFVINFTIPTGGTLTGSHNVIVTWKVYRVAAGGGTRTELFTVAAPEESGNAIAATQATATGTSASQPQFILEAGETIHIGITSTDRQVAGTLSATTAGTITYKTGTAQVATVAVPTGVRSLFSQDMTLEAAPGADAPITRRLYLPREMPETVQGTDLTTPVARSIKAGRDLVENEPTTDALARVYKSFRTLAESVPIGTETLARLFKGFRATTAESIPTTTTLATSFKGDRSITESIPTSDQVPARKFTGTRGLSDATVVSDVLERRALLKRVLSETTTTVDITLDRVTRLGRTNVESIPTFGVLTRLIKQRRFLSEFPTGVTPDYNVEFPTRKIAGIVRDQNGDPYEGAVVKLFRGQDDKMVQETTSAADGSYEFLRDLYDPYTYYVEAYEETGEPTAGVTERGLVPENV